MKEFPRIQLVLEPVADDGVHELRRSIQERDRSVRLRKCEVSYTDLGDDGDGGYFPSLRKLASRDALVDDEQQFRFERAPY